MNPSDEKTPEPAPAITKAQASLALKLVSQACAEFKGSRADHITLEKAQFTLSSVVDAHFAPPPPLPSPPPPPPPPPPAAAPAAEVMPPGATPSS